MYEYLRKQMYDSFRNCKIYFRGLNKKGGLGHKCEVFIAGLRPPPKNKKSLPEYLRQAL